MELFRSLLTPMKIIATWLLCLGIMASLFVSAADAHADRNLPVMRGAEVVIEVPKPAN
ncbi:MAG: hypothetical protein JST92_09400 [Deltaproteobacteria bacterium]|nr:hypothetical protein [Deltaproteobacteria bacterium]